MFALCYVQHGGSGLSGFTPDYVGSLTIPEIMWYIDRLNAERKREADAIRAAYRRG